MLILGNEYDVNYISREYDNDATSAVRPGCAEDTASATENMKTDQR